MFALIRAWTVGLLSDVGCARPWLNTSLPRPLFGKREEGFFMSKKIYKGIDLFCGIGGFRLAMENSGVKCVFSSDNDKFAQETYYANFGEVPQGDIKKIEANEIPPFDILAAGFPCQPFSYAGEKQGFNDEIRGTLFFDICRILEFHKPPMVFLENVKGLKSHEEGKTLTTILDSLKELGYFPHWTILSSLDKDNMYLFRRAGFMLEEFGRIYIQIFSIKL